MEKTHKNNPDDPIKDPVKPAKVTAPTSEEVYHALNAMVVVAETAGGRDNPEVVAAREILQRATKVQ